MARSSLRTQFENFDQRLVRIEQILPTLATKQDLRGFATKEDLRGFATKEELRGTADELRHEIRAEGDRSRRYMDVLTEQLRSDIALLAEHLARIATKVYGG